MVAKEHGPSCCVWRWKRGKKRKPGGCASPLASGPVGWAGESSRLKYTQHAHRGPERRRRAEREWNRTSPLTINRALPNTSSRFAPSRDITTSRTRSCQANLRLSALVSLAPCSPFLCFLLTGSRTRSAWERWPWLRSSSNTRKHFCPPRVMRTAQGWDTTKHDEEIPRARPLDRATACVWSRWLDSFSAHPPPPKAPYTTGVIQ